MTVEFTAAQRNAIGMHVVGKDTCVVAGPGSGKTTVLIERFRGLVESGVSPLRILAITFTEKATNQMRQRLAAAFADRPDLTVAIQRAYVSTVHGFCTRLLRENAILAGVDPRFRVLNEQEAFALERKSVDDALDLFLAESPHPVRDLLRSLDSADLGDSILGIYHPMRAVGQAICLPGSAGESPAPPCLASHCDRILAGSFSDWKPSQKEQMARIAEWRDRLRARRCQPVAALDFQILAEYPRVLSRIPRNNPVHSLIAELTDLTAAAETMLVDSFYASQRATLLDAMARFDAVYRSRKTAQGALDFSDLEEHSVRLLEENEEARERVRRQFDHVLMDEFQDTNGLQSKLLDLLRPADRFYAVGDINQSIYGFRHTDPQLFDAYRSRLQSEGKHVAELRENWRSRGDILSAVLSLLGAADGIEPHTFQPARKFRRKSEPSVEVIRCLAQDADAALALEAKWVAARVTELHGELSASFGDMAVLVRKADSIQAFTDAFDEAGIPYVVTAGKGFFETREVSDLARLLRVLANPRDEISLAAVLRSPLVGLSDQSLFEMKQAGNLADADLGAFGRELDSWREARSYVSADRLLIRAMDRSGYELGLGPRQRANIEKFLTLVREAGSRRSLDDLVEELERLRDSDPREQDSQAEESGDVVRILTIHAAKGLEFPIVFLPALHTAVSTGLAPALFSPRLGLGVRWRNPATGDSAKDSLYEKIAGELGAKAAAESNRLLYVAMTRAEEHLVLSCSGSGKLKNWAAYLESNWKLDLQTPREGPSEERVAAPDGTSFAVRVLSTDRPPAPVQQLSLAFDSEIPDIVSPPPISGQHDSTASVTSIALFADCPRRYYLARFQSRDSHGAVPDEDQPKREKIDASEFGRQVHALLAGGERAGASPAALALAARFEASDLGARAGRSTRVEREFDFLLAIEDIVVRGQIDLWFEEFGELTLVDYKTDEVSAEEASSRARNYELQLQLYAIAVARAAGRKPNRALFYFLRPNLAIPIELDAARATEAVRAFRQAQDSLDFPLREGEHCRRCPFFRGMCPAGGAGRLPEAR
jgi:ATP-dependent exoDNAse (exonuclease V) beta subunit